MIPNSILQATCEILSESLGVSPEEVTPGSYLIEDLGAESIDFLDIFYLAESRLGIRITQDDFQAEIRRANPQGEPSEEDIGRELTAEELVDLARHMPASTHDRIRKGLRVRDIIRLVNVDALAQFFADKVRKREAQAG